MANVHIRFNDDIESYDPSDSETEYTEKEKALLKKTRTRSVSNSESEEEVYGLSAESSSESENENADSDIERKDDDDLPDIRAWGKSRRNFYSTDYVDQDFGGYQGKDAVEAEFEEQEARDIQKRLAEQLNDEDFSLDIFKDKDEQPQTQDAEIIKSDLSTLSKRELHRILQTESPEIFVLIDDCKAKMTAVKSFLHPTIQKYKENKLEDSEAMNFVNTYYHLILNYCSNIYMYLLLKASKVNVQIHPVLKRLYQYRQLLAQLDSIYENVIQPQIEIILNVNDDVPKETVKKVKKLKLLHNLEKSKDSNIESESTDKEPSAKKSKSDVIKSNEPKEKQVTFNEPESENDISVNSENEENVDGDASESKRAITYQMKKNKGLTPHRKKEQRNPRVKHRNKFKKAIIRRKGAVREVRKEITRYGGEISGIKSSVSKSVKFK